MALDTQAKLMNALSWCSPLAWQYHFEINAATDIEDIDRLQLLHLYGGNGADDPSPPSPTAIFKLLGDGGLLVDSFVVGRGGLLG